MTHHDFLFHNLNQNIRPKNGLDVLKWKLFHESAKWPKSVPLESLDIPPKKVDDRHRFRISFVGHVTFLIQSQGLNILTDPVWSDRASPFTFIGPKRVTPPGINFNELPKIDLVLISHNHYDHMDIATIRKLWDRDKPKIYTPLMNDVILKKQIPGIEVITLNWGEKAIFSDNIIVFVEPSQHWSARGLFDQNKALWGTMLVSTSVGTICFLGDSGYSQKLFEDIGKKHKDILISFIPIGAFQPRWFMQDIHMNPEEAVLVHNNLKSQYSFATHFQTFHLADDGYFEPANELALAISKYNISDQQFITPEIGKHYWINC